MKHYEYITDDRPREDNRDRLTYLNWKGGDGWLLVSVTPYSFDDGRTIKPAPDRLLFVREVVSS